jgi:hypothetical protein
VFQLFGPKEKKVLVGADVSWVARLHQQEIFTTGTCGQSQLGGIDLGF